MIDDDGGGAFPYSEKNDDGSHLCTYGGMSIRDWFAGQALAGAAVAEGWSAGTAATRAYAMADAMLAERAKLRSGE